MEQKELKEKFLNLYNYIIYSDDEEKMHVLGNITKAMMMRTIETSAPLAEEYIGKLESVKWNNYLTDKEADVIVSKMVPKPAWPKSTWLSTLEKHDFPACEEPYYNSNALYVTMSMISSDDAETLRKNAGIDDDTKMFNVVYHLALNKLKDQDKVFNIRNYFNV